MSIPAHRDPQLVARATDVLAGISAMCPSLESATLLTDDGFTVAQVPMEAGAGDRMASMASSVQALGDAVTHELEIGRSDYVVIAAERGIVVQRRIEGLPVVLAAHFGAGEHLDAALRVTRSAAEWLVHESTADDVPRRRPRHSA